METKYPNTKVIFDPLKKSSAEKKAPVYVRVTYNRKVKYFSTGVQVLPNQWKNGLVVRHPQADVENKKVKRYYGLVENKIAELWERGSFSFDNLRSAISQEDKPEINPMDWIEQTMLKRNLAEGTRRHQKFEIAAARQFGKFVSWEAFTPENLADYDHWLRTNGNPKSQAAIYNYHKTLKAYLNMAVVQSLIPINPYTRYKVKRGSVALPRYLTEAERDAIAELKNLQPMLDKARDLFIFMCYTGLAYSDTIKIRREDIITENGKLYIADKRTKTKGDYKIMLLPKAVEILEKYDYELPRISNERINDALKLVASAAGVSKRVTCHVARHTFATWAMRSGVRIEVVSKMLAHTDIRTTQIYARVLQEEVDEGFDLLAKK